MVGDGVGTGTMAGVPRDRSQPVYDPTALDPEADRVSRRQARKWWWALVVFVVVVVAVISYLGRQSESEAPRAPKAFCKAAKAYEDEIDRQAERYELDVDRQIARVEGMVATAPKAIRAEAEVFLRSLEEYRDAPNEAARERLKDDPEVKAAVDDVNRYWTQGCGVFDREGL